MKYATKSFVTKYKTNGMACLRTTYFYCPSSKGIDAMIHPWATSEAVGLAGLVYINGPFSMMGAIISKIQKEQINCMLIGPNWPRGWIAVLHSMAAKKAVVLPHRTCSYPVLMFPRGRHWPGTLAIK